MAYKHYSKGFREHIEQFSSGFWIINGLELMERGAYYGTMAILAIHLHDNLDFSSEVTGILTGLLMALLYFVPLVSSALAEKVGGTVLSEPERALCRPQGAGARRKKALSPLNCRELELVGSGGGGGSRTRVPWPVGRSLYAHSQPSRSRRPGSD